MSAPEFVPAPLRRTYLRVMAGTAGRAAAIKVKCFECCGWRRTEDGDDRIGNCGVKTCPLHPYRPFQRKRARKTAAQATEAAE